MSSTLAPSRVPARVPALAPSLVPVLVLVGVATFPATGTTQATPTTVTARLVTLSELQVVANAPSGSVTKTIPALSDISKPFALEAFPPKLESSAYYIPFLEGAPATGWLLDVRDGGNATGAATAKTGGNTVALHLVSSRGQLAQLTVTIRTSALGNGAASSAVVDIGNDGQVEASGSQVSYVTRQLTWGIGPAGLPIRIATGGLTGNPNQARSGFSVAVTIEVRPISNCTATAYGRGCLAGPKLSGRMTWDHEIELQMQNGLRNVPAVLGFGTRQLSLPLPTVLPSCLLHTDLLAVVFTGTDNSGVATVKVPIPKNLKATANAQMFMVQQPFLGFWDIRSTNGLQVTCK
jgi:hypothetical protein